MKIYISGICGTAMGALAIFAKKAGFSVSGSDKSEGAVYRELVEAGIEVKIGEQDGEFLREKIEKGEAEWFVYTSALPKNHPELVLAQEKGLKISKRDELIETIREKVGLKMVAVAGTHGKTTTTAMIVWGCIKLGIPISYLVGSTLPFAGAGKFDPESKFFIYEADEYDKNFLHFHPWLSIITTIDYDHPDIYPTKEEYREAFSQFARQSETVIDESFADKRIKLAGKIRRIDAGFALIAIKKIVKESGKRIFERKIIKILNDFPGVGRRFEKISEGIYSDYAHHPEEIRATVDIAREEAERLKKKGVVVIYEPHQNTRQHEIFPQYKKSFLGARKIFWLPTFLTRENPELPIIPPEKFVGSLENSEDAEVAELDSELEKKLKEYISDGFLVVLMTAGPADGWLRENFAEE